MVWINKLFRNCYDIIINSHASKNKWHAWFAAIGDSTMHYTLESLIAHHLHITNNSQMFSVLMQVCVYEKPRKLQNKLVILKVLCITSRGWVI
jgi:hypothetical protein